MDKSSQWLAQARQLIPGGVNSPVRAFQAVEMDPPFIKSGRGSRLRDEDGREYIDLVCSWGPLILGHRHPAVVAALQEVLTSVGTSFGASTIREVELAAAITRAVPAIEMVRLVNSGTEATMAALRLARAYTGRDKIVKFGGSYHGHADYLLVQAGSGALTFGVPSSPGVPASFTQHTLLADYNYVDGVERVFARYGEEIAAVIVEPVAGNMGCVPPDPGFLHGLREITSRWGSLLIFDEVMTGFRVAYGGAQELYGVKPDLTCLGKIIGGGLPVGAYGGRREIMEQVAPAGPVYQAGTLSGNPLAVTAGLVTLQQLQQPGTYEKLEAMGRQLEEGIKAALEATGVATTFNRVGSMFTLFFTPPPVRDLATAVRSNTHHFAHFFHTLFEEGIYWPPSQFEAAFLSLAHTPDDVQHIVEACRIALEQMTQA